MTHRRGRTYAFPRWRNAAARRGRAWLVPVAGALLAACAAVPEAERADVVQVDAADIELAREARREMLRRFRPHASPAIQDYVQRVGERLAARAPRTNTGLRFTVLDTPGAFAYSFADGDVVLGRGLLLHLNSEAQLAAVLAHEIGHVVSLHQARQWRAARRVRELEARLAERFASAQARDTLGTLSLAQVRGYSRELEIEADVWSERLLASAGYDPGAMAEVLRFFLQQETFGEQVGVELWDLPESGGGQGVFATHPSPAARVEQAAARLGKRIRASAPTAPDPAYLRVLQGMTYGLAEHHGVLRGRRYVHPARRVGFTLPEGWYLFGSDERLVAAPRTHAGLVLIDMRARADAEPRRHLLEELARGRPLPPVASLTADGARGESVVIRAETEGGAQPVRLAAIDVGDQRLGIVGISLVPEEWSEMDAELRELLRSLRAVPATEAGRARPVRVHIEQARIGRALAPGAQVFHDHAHERWELLNQLYPKGEVATGRWIKTVR